MVTVLLHLFLQSLTALGPVSAAPVEWLNGTEYDFGAMEQGIAQSVTFRFKNHTDAHLALETVRTTCGCTAADWTEAPVAPGETGAISIQYDAAQTGVFRKKIRVFFFQQRKAEVLWISGEVN